LTTNIGSEKFLCLLWTFMSLLYFGHTCAVNISKGWEYTDGWFLSFYTKSRFIKARPTFISAYQNFIQFTSQNLVYYYVMHLCLHVWDVQSSGYAVMRFLRCSLIFINLKCVQILYWKITKLGLIYSVTTWKIQGEFRRFERRLFVGHTKRWSSPCNVHWGSCESLSIRVLSLLGLPRLAQTRQDYISKITCQWRANLQHFWLHF
jgi:hypothetical protein